MCTTTLSVCTTVVTDRVVYSWRKMSPSQNCCKIQIVVGWEQSIIIHTIRSATAENPMLYANFTALCVIEAELLTTEAYITVMRIVDVFCSREPVLDPMTFMYEPHQYSLERYTGWANINFLREGFQKLSSDRQTDRQTRPTLNTTPFARGGKGQRQNRRPSDYRLISNI